MIKILGLTTIALNALLLTGCGGGSEPTAVTSISQIEGLWDFSDTDGGVKDISYLNIASSGSLILYDYLADDYDNGPDCYDNYDFGTLTKTGDKTFQIQKGTTHINVNATLDNNILNIKNTTTGEVDSLPKASISLSEITSKLCSNM